MEAAGVFTTKMRQAVELIFQKIISCDFVTGLSNGTLPKAHFAHYLSQDVLYIGEDTRALATTAARAHNPKERVFFQQLAQDGLDIERSLHDEFLSLFQVSPAQDQSPVCKTYTTHLINSTTNKPYAVGASALLPCFWIYLETGDFIMEHNIPGNNYQPWINTYSGETYRDYTKRFIHIIENLGQGVSYPLRQEMIDAFVKSTELELAFFKEATTN